MDLPELISARRDHIIQRFTAKVRGTLHPESMPRVQLVDHLPLFLDEIARSLRRGSRPDVSVTAAEHGTQRLAQGFDLNSVVREYGALGEAIVEEAEEQGVPVNAADQSVLYHRIITGIAEAVSEYTRQRDAELHRQSNEHFAFIAHELRNPLGAVMGALDAILRTSTVKDDRFLQILKRGLSRMHELIETTLRSAQVGAGVTLRPDAILLSALLNDVELGSSFGAEEKGITLTTRIEKDCELVIDTRLVSSALTNLVRNAVKFSHEKGRIEVRASVAAGRVTVEVEDSCGGLPDGMVEKAFLPFSQMGKDRTGFGLGLAIAKQAAEAHGGTIRIQNIPGKGCIFILELPLKPAA
jgi:signal transduction histidine kinase